MSLPESLFYAQILAAVRSKLVIVSTNDRIDEQLAVTGISDVIGRQHLQRRRAGGRVGDSRPGRRCRMDPGPAAQRRDRRRLSEHDTHLRAVEVHGAWSPAEMANPRGGRRTSNTTLTSAIQAGNT